MHSPYSSRIARVAGHHTLVRKVRTESSSSLHTEMPTVVTRSPGASNENGAPLAVARATAEVARAAALLPPASANVPRAARSASLR